MRKIYLLLLSGFIFSNANAQYTLTAAGNNPVIGETGTIYRADTAHVLPGAAGANQYWNFTGIVVQTTATAVNSTYTTTSAAPNYTAFPGTNIAQTDGSGAYSMWLYNTSGAYLYGFTTPSLTVSYSNPETLYTIPFTYGFTSNDNFGGTFTISGYTAVRSGTVTTIGDGYGTLRMPHNQTYNNVLRIKLQQTTTDVISAINYTSTEVSDTYVFVSGTSKTALLSITDKTTTTTFTSTTVQKDRTVDVNSISIVGMNEHKKEANFSIYPNPTNTAEVSLFYVITNSENYEVSVLNPVGQVVKSYSIGTQAPGMYNQIIKLDGLAKGMYFIKLKGRENEGVQKIIIE